MPTSSTEKIVSRRRADHSYAAVPPQNAAAGGGCNTCVWHSSSDSRRRRSFAQHGTNNPLRLTDPKASTTIYVSPACCYYGGAQPFWNILLCGAALSATSRLRRRCRL